MTDKPRDSKRRNRDMCERQAFIDAAAIALYAQGRPAQKAFAEAEILWETRARLRAQKV